MPIRGLRDTAPFHWDGIPGDPYGGNNSAKIHGSDPPNSSVDDPASSTRHLIDGGLAATMAMVGETTVNDEGKAGALSAAERDDMATFLLSVPYPPAQRRAYTNELSDRAQSGFELFHIKGHLDGKPKPNVCGNCHRMPFWVSTNTPGTGMDAPTWRGAYDRFLILPQGRLNIIDFDFYRRIAERGIPERKMWQFSWQGKSRFDPIWDMVLEGSTGFSGSFARQLTLSDATASDDLTSDLFAALETSAREGAIVLEAEGVLLGDHKHKFGEQASGCVSLQFDPNLNGGTYVQKTADRNSFEREDLVLLASNGQFIGTFTARHGAQADVVDHPQPALWTPGPIEKQSGRQKFPMLYDGKLNMTVSGRHIHRDAHVIVDGRRVPGSVRIPDGEQIEIALPTLPPVGMHLLQIQNPDGLFSNDFIFYVTADEAAAVAWKRNNDREHEDWRNALARAIRDGNVEEAKNLRRRGAPINDRRPRGSSIPLSIAARHGQLEIVQYFIKHRVKVNGTNRDGSTALHTAAFFCRPEIVKLLLKHGASPEIENKRGETPIDVVSAPWSKRLSDRYAAVGKAVRLELDLENIEKDRPEIAKLLQAHVKTSASSTEDQPDADN